MSNRYSREVTPFPGSPVALPSHFSFQEAKSGPGIGLASCARGCQHCDRHNPDDSRFFHSNPSTALLRVERDSFITRQQNCKDSSIGEVLAERRLSLAAI